MGPSLLSGPSCSTSYDSPTFLNRPRKAWSHRSRAPPMLHWRSKFTNKQMSDRKKRGLADLPDQERHHIRVGGGCGVGRSEPEVDVEVDGSSGERVTSAHQWRLQWQSSPNGISRAVLERGKSSRARTCTQPLRVAGRCEAVIRPATTVPAASS
jgi:hypothetical protein